MASSTIERFDYDVQTQVLSIWFAGSGRRYDYDGVDPFTVEAFRRAPSQGRFFNERIRDRYPGRWMPWDPAASAQNR